MLDAPVVDSGVTVAPGAGAAIVTLTNPVAGTYIVDVYVQIAEGTPAAAERNNMELRRAAAVLTDLIVPVASGAANMRKRLIVNLNGSQNLSVNATGAATAAVAYHAMLVAHRVVDRLEAI